MRVESTRNRGVNRYSPSHLSSRSSEVHMRRNLPQGMLLSDLQRGRNHRVNEGHNVGRMRIVTALLQAGHPNLMPEKVGHIQSLLRSMQHEPHQGDSRAAAM